MEDNRKKRVLDAATRIIAEEGYTQAKIYKISEEAGVASGLIYSPNFFKNKLDLLLSIVVNFWEILNERIAARVKKSQDPIQKLDEVLKILEELLKKDNQSIYLFRVAQEALPYILVIKDNELAEKRKKITKENRKLLRTFDEIIKEGQETGQFDNSLKPAAMRQALFGAFELLIYGLFLKISRNEKIGYNERDISKTMHMLIRKFLGK